MEQSVFESVARFEERFDHVTERLEKNAEHQEKMWDKIDEVVETLIELKQMFKSAELHRLHEVDVRVTKLEVKNNSLWKVAAPLLYTGGGVIVTKLAQLLIH